MNVLECMASREQVISRALAAGKRIAAVLPVHYPRAVFHACGFQPIELWGPPRVDSEEGDRHLQAYACAIVRNATSLLLEGALDRCEVVLVPHTCDALQGMGSVLRDFGGMRQRVLTLYHPRARGAADLEFFAQEIARLAEELACVSGRTATDAEWVQAIDADAQADAALADLYRDRRKLMLSDREFYTVVRTREYLPPADFKALADGLPRGQAAAPRGVPLMLSGMVCEPMSLFDHINAMGGCIVADDLACGYRRLYPPFDAGPPFERMARSLLGAPPDPTRGTSIEERATALIERMRAAGARGLVIYGVKYCEPELFELPRLRAYLAEAGYPMLHVEHEVGVTVPQQAVTRIEAFVETLQ
jgi:benzoyl-CoA reductase/2-hydroxyglutaryl-CoA dehydratase subunit BcrC/BadD/HgdB